MFAKLEHGQDVHGERGQWPGAIAEYQFKRPQGVRAAGVCISTISILSIQVEKAKNSSRSINIAEIFSITLLPN